ncbi:MAG TPA: TetR family transcriptional regulator [Solirubrobacteraceae bacterium]|nr:TetR family transcriptional regulator [Solirubrobacteraceae bacterium]
MAARRKRTQDAGVEPDEQAAADDGPIGALPGEESINRLIVEELGPAMAAAFQRTRAAQDRWARSEKPGEGLRERKKRLTRQQISDVATTLFIVRGFERVTIAQIADAVGVSEKTVYNYFPTKESLLFDRADEGRERLAQAMRTREPTESPTKVMLRELDRQTRELQALPEESQLLLPLFADMVASTPALRAAWLELNDQLAEVVTAELAHSAEVDPNEPEPAIAGRAIVSLMDLSFQSRIRHIESGLRGAALADAISEDLQRAARLLDTGLWSFNVLSQTARGRAQMRDAVAATEDARRQVMKAMRQARSAWQQLHEGAHAESRQTREDTRRAREADRETARQARDVAREAARAVGEEAKRVAKERAAAIREETKRAVKEQTAAMRDEAKRAAKEQAAAIRGEAKRAKQEPTTSRRGTRHAAKEAAASSEPYEAFRQAMAERHPAIRERERERR